MLVLTRKLGEGITIGDDIEIIVMQIKGRQVRIGIKADPRTPVYREEVYRKIREENRLASRLGPEHLQKAPRQFFVPSVILGRTAPSPLKRRKRPPDPNMASSGNDREDEG